MKGIHPNSVLAYWQGNDGLFGQRHQKVIEVLRRSTLSKTDREVMVACGFTDPNAVRPRITELIEAGILVETASTECPVTHKTVRLVALRKIKPAAQFEMTDILTDAVVAKLGERRTA